MLDFLNDVLFSTHQNVEEIFHQKKIVLIFVVAKMKTGISYDNYSEMNNKYFLLYVIFSIKYPRIAAAEIIMKDCLVCSLHYKISKETK